MALVTGVKSYIYTSMTGLNYAVSYCSKILQIYHQCFQLDEITPLVTGVKSYIYKLPTGRNYAVSHYTDMRNDNDNDKGYSEALYIS